MSSPEGFTLPLMDDSQDRERATSLPMAAPPPTIPLAPPPSIPVVPPGSIPLAPPTAIPVTAPVALSPVRTLEETDLAPFTPPSAGDVGIVTVERGGGGQGEPEVAIDEVLLYLLEKGGSDLHLSVNSPPMIRVHGDLEPVPGYRATDCAAAAGVDLLAAHGPPEAALRGDQGARPGLRDAGCCTLPRQPDAAAGCDLGGPPRDPLGDPAARRVEHAADPRGLRRPAAWPRAGDRARPGPASRRPSRRSSTRPTARARATSSRSRTRSSSSTSTASAW